MDQEIWRPVPDWPEYEVSSHGRVKRDGALRKISKTPRGYSFVELHRGKVNKTFRINRLVALVFVPNPEGHEFVAFRDHDKTNLRASNLKWTTLADATQSAFEAGRNCAVGNENAVRKLSVEDVREIRARAAADEPQRSLAKFYKVSETHVSRIVAGEKRVRG